MATLAPDKLPVETKNKFVCPSESIQQGLCVVRYQYECGLFTTPKVSIFSRKRCVIIKLYALDISKGNKSVYRHNRRERTL